MIPADVALLRTPGPPVLSPDGRTAVWSVLQPDLASDEPVGALWRAPTDGSAPPVLLTRGHRDTAPAFSPDGRWITFLRALPGEPAQLHLVEASGGEPVRLTDTPLGVSEPRFSPDGTRIAFLARVPAAGRYLPGGSPAAEPPRLVTTLRYRADNIGFLRDRPQHLHAVDLPVSLLDGTAPDWQSADGVPDATALTAGDLDVVTFRWLPDGEHLVAVAAVHPGREQDLRRDAVLVLARPPADVRPPAPRPLTHAAAGSNLAVETVAPSPDGATLWLLAGDLGPTGTDFVAALTGLYALDLPAAVHAAHRAPDVLTPRPRRLTDPGGTDLVPGLLVVQDGRVLVADQHHGAVRLLALPADPLAELPLPEEVLLDAPVVVIGADTVEAGPVVAAAAGPLTAGEILVIGPDGPRRLADPSEPLRATGRLRTGVELTATAPDGYPVHGWLTLPTSRPGPHPTILMIHGGPFAQYTAALLDEVQVLVEAGYAVVHGNPRGSAGYGAPHGRAIVGAFGTVDADDVIALLDAALDDPEHRLDPARVGVMGGSYGGYLTAWLTTRTERFCAAVVERGFLDPVSFVGSSDIGWFFGLAYLGDPATCEGAAVVAAQSPMAHVGAVRTPTLVIHSEQDWRCPVEQGQRWFVELTRRGVPAELLLFPGEGHELTRSGRPTHRIARFEHLLDWWARYLPVTP